MNWKIFTLGIFWLIASVCWILLWSVQDKEWWIGQGDIRNICDLMKFIENDDSRDLGMLLTLPIFFPTIYAFWVKRLRDWFFYLVTVAVATFWLWQFVIRYQLCLW